VDRDLLIISTACFLAAVVRTAVALRAGVFRPGRFNFLAIGMGFLFQTAFRVASDSRRTRRRQREVPDDLLALHTDERPGPDQDLEARLRRAQLDRILDKMPLELRAVFVLSEIEELTMAQIAVLMDIPPGTVASRLRRAREQFSKHVTRLQQKEGEGGT